MLLLLACAPEPTDSEPTAASPATRTVISLSAYFGGDIHLYDEDGAPLGTLDGVDGAQTLVLSPSGELIAAAEGRNQLLRFDARTFAPLGVLADGADAGFNGPTAAVFGPDGMLYVGSFEDDRVVRLTADGHYVDDVVTAGSGGLDGPDIGLAFGPDGALYVPSWYDGAVYAWKDGAMREVIPADAGYSGPRGIVWDGEDALVAMNGSSVILRAGATVETFGEARRPDGLALLGDKLLVASGVTNKVQRWDMSTGASEGVFIDDDAVDGLTVVAVLELPEP